VFITFPELAGSDATSVDLCIVGAGPVGIALALALEGSGARVLLVEAGGMAADTRSQDVYRGHVSDPRLHSPLIDYRERRFGGTSTIWGGRCMPLDDVDFEPRDWIAASGWPIGPHDLAPYYPEANALCEAGAFDYRAASALPADARPMIAGYRGQDFTTDRLERFSCPTDFGKRYRDRLARAQDVRVVLDTGVDRIALAADGGRVAGIDLRGPDGRTVTIAPRETVLCAGGLETARLLLASRDVHNHGIGNHHDVLGRYYMCHLAGTIGTFRAAGGRDAVWHGYDVADDGTYCRRRLALTEAAQRRHRTGNVVARLHHPRIADARHGSAALSALYLGRALIPRLYRSRLAGDADAEAGGVLHHVANVARDPVAVARFALHTLTDRTLAERKFPSVIVVPRNGRYSLDFHAEQEPNPDSRVRLGDDVDDRGVPRLIADWRYTAGDVATVKTALRLLAADLAQAGVGTFDYDEDQVETEMTRYGAYPGHHIGTVRMGDDPRTSMVDRDCRIHGVANLHVVGAAVFPTSSQANPTLTAVALALRLAAHLRKRTT
jgi:choline dehydrogenase-like flavoprotein